MLRRLLAAVLLLFLFSCGEQGTGGPDTRLLFLGDSMFASNRAGGGSVAQVVESVLGQEVIDRSVVGARYFYALPISGAAGLRLDAQYRPGPWQAVVINGGGNDILFGCGCGRCTGVLNRLISPDGRLGAIPNLVARIRENGAVVVYVGYLRNPGIMTPIKACGPAGNELDRRLKLLEKHQKDFTFLPMSDLVPYRDTSYHQVDLIHPSRKGSRAIGIRVARALQLALAPAP